MQLLFVAQYLGAIIFYIMNIYKVISVKKGCETVVTDWLPSVLIIVCFVGIKDRALG